MKAKAIYCKEADRVAYIPLAEDFCPFCNTNGENCTELVTDEYGARVGYGVDIDKKYIIQNPLVKCEECGEEFYPDPDKEGETWCKVTLFNDPWSENGEEVHVHVGNEKNKGMDYGDCYDKLSDTSWADFRYLDCPICNRKVIRQSPANGWHSYTRILNDEEVCIACFEKELLVGNIEPIDDDGCIVGMFFNWGELAGKGFELIEDCFFIGSKNSKTKYVEMVNSYVEQGYIVVNEYESMGLGGGEGTLNLWIKKREVK